MINQPNPPTSGFFIGEKAMLVSYLNHGERRTANVEILMIGKAVLTGAELPEKNLHQAPCYHA